MRTFEQLGPAGRAVMLSIRGQEFVAGQQYSRAAIEHALAEQRFSPEDIGQGIEECSIAELIHRSAKGVGTGQFFELTSSGRGVTTTLVAAPR